MNSNYTLKAMKVNEGNVQASETPLWAGTSKVADAINGRYCAMSVTLDRDWLWVRFSQQPSEGYRKQLTSSGFIYSRKRGGWHAPLSQLVCDKVADWGAITISYHKLASHMPERKPVENLTKHIDLDAPVVKQSKPQASQPAKKAKPASQPSQDVVTLTMLEKMTEMMSVIASLQQEIVNLKAQQPAIQPLPTTNYSNGYHVGGVSLK